MKREKKILKKKKNFKTQSEKELKRKQVRLFLLLEVFLSLTWLFVLCFIMLCNFIYCDDNKPDFD